MGNTKRKPFPQVPVEAEIESLTRKGRGRTYVDGKPVHVHGALPGERVSFRYTKTGRARDEGIVVEVLTASPLRVTPRCPHTDICGGCSLQHMAADAQIRWKAQILADTGKVQPERWLPPLAAGHWGYRRKARLGVRFVEKKGRTLVGFRERGNSFVADLERCEILHPAVGERLQAIAALIDGLSIRERVPQIEIAMGDGPCVLVFRVLDPPTADDIARLSAFGAASGLRIYLQDGGAQSIRPPPGQDVELHYLLFSGTIKATDADLAADHVRGRVPGTAGGQTGERARGTGLRLHFEPTDFTQVNLELNRSMVDQALRLLDPQPDERVLDLFCGLGNFTLPLARRAAQAVGVEGDAGLVERARANAERNQLANASFHVADLYGDLESAPWISEGFHKALLDPPRSGALAVVDRLPALGIERVLYVSCNPSTLAQDADRLVNVLGYRLTAAGAMDMFPHTAHLEAMALFERG